MIEFFALKYMCKFYSLKKRGYSVKLYTDNSISSINGLWYRMPAELPHGISMANPMYDFHLGQSAYADSNKLIAIKFNVSLFDIDDFVLGIRGHAEKRYGGNKFAELGAFFRNELFFQPTEFPYDMKLLGKSFECFDRVQELVRKA